jgi:tetratricopeptide (TPR) repeat protein
MKLLERAKTMRQFFAAAGLIVALLPTARAADDGGDYAARDVALLPAYCKYEPGYRDHVPGGNDPLQTEHWKAILSYMYPHLHHYCWGMQQTNYAMLFAPNAHERMAFLRYSIGNFDYVIKYMAPDYPLLPEVLTKKGENLIRLGQVSEAMAPLQRAIEVKPDYWPPYAVIADYYKQVGDLAKARDWLKKGLSVTPDAPALKRRLQELDRAKAGAGASRE